MYRLHIDIPLDCDLETAKQIGLAVVNAVLEERAKSSPEMFIMSVDSIEENSILDQQETSPLLQMKQMNYRMGNDEDRQKSNYYIMDGKGHVTNKKCVIEFTEDGVFASTDGLVNKKGVNNG